MYPRHLVRVGFFGYECMSVCVRYDVYVYGVTHVIIMNESCPNLNPQL